MMVTGKPCGRPPRRAAALPHLPSSTSANFYLSVFCIFCIFFLPLSLARPPLRPSSLLQEDSCLPCPAGTFSPPDNKNCSLPPTECGAGFCVNTSWCLPCPTGSVNDKSNASSCTPCPDGKVAQPPFDKCRPCPAGMTSSPEHDRCQACTAGYFNPSVAGTCEACPAGSYSERNSVRCFACPSGTFNDKKAQAGCRQCPSGHYCPGSSISPRQCPSDHYCKAGASSPAPCEPLFLADAGSSDCRPGVTFYVVIGLGAGTLVVLGVVAWVTISYRRPLWKWAKKTYRRHRRQRDLAQAAVTPATASAAAAAKPLIPEPLPGPVYAGL